MYYIYEIRNLTTNKRYIGRTQSPEKRKHRHFNDLKNGRHHCIYLQRSYNKYGVSNFKFTILEEVETFEEVCDRELYYLNSGEDLYNISKLSTGGDLISYHPNKNKIRQKISKASKEYWDNMTPEERQRRSNKLKGKNNPNYDNRGENNPLYGIPLSEEHKKKISKSNKGKKMSQEAIAKANQHRKGKIPWNKGKTLSPLTEEHKRKLSKSLKGRKNEKCYKPVICEGYYFKNLEQASQVYNISSSGMEIRLNSTSEKFKGFYYFDDRINKIEDYIIYEEGMEFKSNLKGDTREKKVYCEGEILTVKQALKKYNLKSANALDYRCKSTKEKWKEFYYI